jgi:zinc protease
VPLPLVLVLLAALACEEAPRYGAFQVPRPATSSWRPATASSTTPDEPFRAKMPDPPTLESPPLPTVREGALPNGVRLVTLERHALPIVSVRIVVAGGAARARAGVAAMASAMLFEGTTHSSGKAVHATLSQMGATYTSSVSQDAVSIDAKVPAPNLMPALRVLVHVVRLAAFPDEELDRVRGEQVARSVRARATPSSLARQQLAAMLYPEGSPYGRPAEGDPESLRTVTREELARFWSSVAVPSRTTFLLAGDVDRAALEAHLRPLLDDWADVSAPPEPVAAPPRPARRTVFLDHPGDSQTVVTVGWLVADRESADIPALQGVAAALTRGSSGLLDRIVRAQRGETYGVQAWLTLRPGASELVVQTAIESDKTADGLGAILQEIEKARVQLPPGVDLAHTRALVSALTWHSFETSADAVATLTPVGTYREPVDRFLARLLATREVTADQMPRVASRWLPPEARAVALVGDARVVPTLASLGLGPLETRRLGP